MFYPFMGMFNLYFILRLMELLILGYLDKFTVHLDYIRDDINIKNPHILVN